MYLMNGYTGELYDNIFHAIRSIIEDMIKFPQCRTIKMFKLEKIK